MTKMKDKAGICKLFRLNFFILLSALFLLERNPVSAQTYCEDKPKILFYRRGEAALVNGDESGNGNENHVVVSNVNKEFLACVSSRNVEWTYEGEGEPSKFQESSNVDIQKYEDGSISYCLTSQVTFYNKQSDSELSRHTGRYICREIGNNTNAASVYVYASKKNSPTFLHSRKTVELPLNQGNITGSEENPGNSSISPSFTIPCATTRPTVSVKLLKKGKNNLFSSYNGAAHEFDPRYGFRVSVKTTNLNDLSEFYGEYKCVSKNVVTGRVADSGPVEDFVMLTIIKGKSLKIYPPVTEVYTSGMLNLTCESEEPVIMKEVMPPSAQDIYSYLDEDDYGRDRSDDIIETTEKTEQTSHIANYMELAPAPGRTGEFQCLTEKDGKILHSWKYRIIRKRADKLSGIKFNKREKSFTCKSKLGVPGKLSFISCRTPSECRINKVCLTKSESCRGYSNSTKAFCERKSHFCGKIFYKGGSGLIRCVGEGIDEIRGFTDEAADQAVRMGFGKLKASETALLQLLAVDKKEDGGDADNNHNASEQIAKQDGSGVINRISEGDRINVSLRLGYYYFLYPVQWAVKFRNGSTSQLNPDPQTLQVDKLTRTVHASLELPYTSATILKAKWDPGSVVQPQPQPQISEIVGLNALIPLRSSTEPSWKTISLPITIYGKVGLSRLPIDAESEEVEQPPQPQQAPTKNIPEGKEGELASVASLVNDPGLTPTESPNIEADEEEEEDDENINEKSSNAEESKNEDKTDKNTTGDDEAEATTLLPAVDSIYAAAVEMKTATTLNALKDQVVNQTGEETGVGAAQLNSTSTASNITEKVDVVAASGATDVGDKISNENGGEISILARSGLVDEDLSENQDDIEAEAEVAATTLPPAPNNFARLLNEELREENDVTTQSEIEITTTVP
ncbi:unnamed protein product [Orchesella dallaii]|uniref:Ig-like domain-containing protein n=1 Tax=Orchesella dallaii TaxID=48710 RepID=A0ABP1QMM9_9HEXA